MVVAIVQLAGESNAAVGQGKTVAERRGCRGRCRG